MSDELSHDQRIEYETMLHDHALEKERMKYWMRGQVWAGCISATAIGGSVTALFFGAEGWAVGVISTEFVALMALFLRKHKGNE